MLHERDVEVVFRQRMHYQFARGLEQGAPFNRVAMGLEQQADRCR